MRVSKCRLCSCAIDGPGGLSSSIDDERFYSMIKEVFRFQISATNYSLPALVCYQCSSTVRNFYYFSQHVRENQKKLEHEREANRLKQTTAFDDCSITELLQRIKTEPELGSKESSHNLNDSTMMVTDSEPAGVESITETSRAVTSDPGSESEDELDTDTDMRLPSQCTIQDEVVGKLDTMDKRIRSVTAKLSALTKNIYRREISVPSPESVVSINFQPIATEHDITTFNNDLEDKDYFKKILDWLTSEVTAVYYENRMLEAQDLLFHKKFLLDCSWTGTAKHSTKIALKTFRNVLKLFKTIGSTPLVTVSDTLLTKYFAKKLKHAKQRLLNKGVRKSTCCIRRT